MKTRSAKGGRVRKTPRLGQHFLTNPVVARSVAEGAGVGPGVATLEIGPGTGALTRVLLELGADLEDGGAVLELALGRGRGLGHGEVAGVGHLDVERLETLDEVAAADGGRPARGAPLGGAVVQGDADDGGVLLFHASTAA